jgi:hypothetical protein
MGLAEPETGARPASQLATQLGSKCRRVADSALAPTPVADAPFRPRHDIRWRGGLPDRGQHGLTGQDLDSATGLVEAFEPTQRLHERIDVTGVKLSHPRVHIPANWHDHKVRATSQQLSLASQRSSADSRTRRQGSQTRRPRREQRIARVVTRQYAGDRKPVG